MPKVAAEHREWLSLQDASERIGVSPATLRSWADQGRVRSFRTPGGHRRFRAADVNSLTSAPRRRSDLRRRVLEHSALGHTRLAIDHSRLQDVAWFEKFNHEARAVYRDLGRKLLHFLTDQLQEQRDDVDRRSRQLGKEYARELERFGITLRDAVGAFIFFRSSFMESVMEFSQGMDDQKPESILELYRNLDDLIDRVLLSMVEAYETTSQR